MAVIVWVVRDTWEMKLRNLRESYDLTLQGWACALEFRDGETAGHAQRLIDLSVALARRFGLNEEEIRALQRGAYLHDLGKMAILNQILLKSGPLVDEEWEIMKQHPVRSREFIAEIPFLQSGYSSGIFSPQTLGRERIPRRPAGKADSPARAKRWLLI